MTTHGVSLVVRWTRRVMLTTQANFETITLFVSVMLVNLLLQDGKSNYMEGLMRESIIKKNVADYSYCAIPCDRALVHSIVKS